MKIAVGLSGGAGVTDRMGDAGVRNTADTVDVFQEFFILFCHVFAVAVAGAFGVDPFITA